MVKSPRGHGEVVVAHSLYPLSASLFSQSASELAINSMYWRMASSFSMPVGS